MKRTILAIASWTFAAACLAAPPAPARKAPLPAPPAASRPAPAPATQPGKVTLDDLPDKLRNPWLNYISAWTGTSTPAQVAADGALVNAILSSTTADAAVLRQVMLADFDHLLKAGEGEEFRAAHSAARIALTWTASPPKDTPNVELVLYQQKACEEIVRWSVQSLELVAATMGRPDLIRTQRPFIPGTALSMVSLCASRGPHAAAPDAVLEKLTKLRPELSKAVQVDRRTPKENLDKLNELLDLTKNFAALGRDKKAIAAMLSGYAAAYNARDVKGVYPVPGSIEPGKHKLVRFEVVNIQARDDSAVAYVIVQYESADGAKSEPALEKKALSRTKDGWRML